MTTIHKDTLEPGRKYNVTVMQSRFAGWAKEGSTLGRHLHGYNMYDYFDGEGRYLGVDTEGVEPMFYPADADEDAIVRAFVRSHEDSDEFDDAELEKMFRLAYGRRPSVDDWNNGLWSLICASIEE